LKCYYSAKS